MICLNNTDTLEGGASVASKVDYTVYGLVGGAFTKVAHGQLSDTNPSVLYTAAAAISIVSVVYVNTHTSAVTVDLYVDDANGGNPRRQVPKALSLGAGYSMHFDGARFLVSDTNGGVVVGVSVDDTAFAASWDGIVDKAPSKNAVYDASLQKLLTTTGDTAYASAANTLARLAIGSPYAKLSVNAAGTLPEWSEVVAFSVTKSASQDNIAANTDVTITFDTEIFDLGNDFAANILTAPVTRKYQLNSHSFVVNLDQAAGYYYYIKTSNRNYLLEYDLTKLSADPSYWSFAISELVDMDAADTAYMVIYQAGGAAQADIQTNTFFTGFLAV